MVCEHKSHCPALLLKMLILSPFIIYSSLFIEIKLILFSKNNKLGELRCSKVVRSMQWEGALCMKNGEKMKSQTPTLIKKASSRAALA